MATFRLPILNFAAQPGSSGNVWFEPASVGFGSNDRYPHTVAVFKDTSTKDSLAGKFVVPKNYVGTPKIIVAWSTAATSGDAIFDFDYTAVGGDAAESLDPSADQQSVTVTDAASGTARQRQECEMALTAANLAVDDEVLFNFSRDGASSDTIAASVYVFSLFFQYTDA